MRFGAEGTTTAATALPSGVVESQLDRIIASSHFADAPRLKRFLQYVIDESLAGNEGRLKGYTIALEVFDRPEDFDPQTDTIVRVQAVQLRRRLDLYYADEGRDDPLRISIPKGTYAPLFQVQLDPETPRGLDREHQPAEPAVRAKPSIAVLPFQNLSGNTDDQYFADGLTEETIANLARFKDLFVFSRSTTTSLVQDGADIRQLHRELGVDFVIEGSVRKTPDKVRVTAQLIDAATNGHIFAEQFERPCTPDGVFEIQDQIAMLVAARVADRYGPLGRHGLRAHRRGRWKNWETYQWILRFYRYYSTHDIEEHLAVREGLEEALKSDPESSDGWAALAAILLTEYSLHINERPTVPALERASEYAKRAVACDPENAFAQQFLALSYFHSRQFSEFHAAAERAIALNPGHADVLADIGVYLTLLGDWERGLPLVDRAIELSPTHPGWYHLPRACRHLLDGEFDAGLDEVKKVPMPGFFWYHALIVALHGMRGEKSEAVGEIEELLAAHPEFAESARRELRIWCIYDELADAFTDGWRKAGLKID